MFIDILDNLCASKSTTVTGLLKELGLSTSKGSAWRNGSIPNGKILSQIANYFGVSVDYLLTGERKESPAELKLDEARAWAIAIINQMTDEDFEAVSPLLRRLQERYKDK